MSNAWFKVERTGLAAKPTGWQGWAVVAAYVVALGALTWTLMLRHGDAPDQMSPMLWLSLVAGLTVGLLVIVRFKTEGRWFRGREGANDDAK